MALLVLLVSIALSTLVSTLAGAVVLRSLGVGVPRIDLGVWGPKVRFAARGSDVSLTPWLISGASTFKDVGNAERYADRPGTLFSAWSRPVRALVQLAGPAAVLAVACLFAGTETVVAFGAGFRQVLIGALHPLSTAQAYLSAFETGVVQSPVSSVGIALAKFAAFTMLPVPPLNGGQVFVELCRPRDRAHGRIAAAAQRIGLIVVLAIVLLWLVAAGAWLANGGAS